MTDQDISPLVCKPLLCAYCRTPQSLVNFVSRKTIDRYKSKRIGLHFREPICSECWGRFSKKVAVSSVIGSDVDAAVFDEIDFIVEVCRNVSATNSFSALTSAFVQIERLRTFEKNAAKEFESAAIIASALAQRYESIKTARAQAIRAIEEAFRSDYETCREIANRHISTHEVRRRIFDRDGWKCRVCGSSLFLTVDHVTPVLRGGGNDDNNLQCLCLTCNCRKGSRCHNDF